MNRSLKVYLPLSVLVMFGFQNCTQVRFQAISPNESFARKADVFAGGVESVDGKIPSENLRVYNLGQAEASFVRDCSEPGLKEKERLEVLAEASADKTNKTIPIAYAISLGNINDGMAYWAHKRAVLSEDNEGKSYIPVGPKTSTRHVRNGAETALYYIVNHDKAKSEFIQGKRCFYSTVKVESEKAHPEQYYDFIKGTIPSGLTYNVHNVHYMYYGWCAGGNCAADGNYGKSDYANRLFSELPSIENGQRQIVKLYMADLRESHFGLQGKTVLKATNGQRGMDLEMDMKDVLHLEHIHQNMGQIIRNLSSSFKTTDNTEFAGMKGVPQLLHNLVIAGGEGTVMAATYTPIVLDLGQPKIFTSSVTWGTFFDMATTGDRGLASVAEPHRTAWISGPVTDWAKKMKDGKKFPMDARRTAEDGFLALPDAQGKITSSRQLFGDRMVVDGLTHENGFIALQKLAKKDCKSDLVKDRYVGPWDGELYSSKLKIWVDADRNGNAEAEEISSLASHGVLAFNACNIDHSEANDAFGNGTNLRSTFLKKHEGETTVSEQEIISRIELGTTSEGKKAEFRLAIDLIFQANEDLKLK